MYFSGWKNLFVQIGNVFDCDPETRRFPAAAVRKWAEGLACWPGCHVTLVWEEEEEEDFGMGEGRSVEEGLMMATVVTGQSGWPGKDPSWPPWPV